MTTLKKNSCLKKLINNQQKERAETKIRLKRIKNRKIGVKEIMDLIQIGNEKI